MPWLRTGDTAAHHPIVEAVREHPLADERALNECYGWVLRCAQLAAAHLTDYVVGRGTAIGLAGGVQRADELLAMARFAGYFTGEQQINGRTYYTLVQDPEFIHMRRREEIEWERQRKRDNSNPALIIPVRYRDGDGCRICAVVVSWTARTGGRAGTYHHLEPQAPTAATPDKVVVACKSCNSSIGDNPESHPPLPAPETPYYSDHTRTWLAQSAWARRNGYTLPPARPGTQPAPAPTRPAPADTATVRPAPADTAPPADAPRAHHTRQDLTGADTPAPDRPGRDGTGAARSRASPPRRARRGRHGRTPPHQHPPPTGGT